jgi:two-component system, NtrC family, nitrogen regulation sensor histidine kinase GlnL
MLGTPRWAFDWPLLLVIATLLVALGYRVWRDRRARDVNQWFAFQALILAGWVTGVAGTYSGILLDFWLRWTFATAALIPLAFLGFIRIFPERTPSVGISLWLAVSAVSVLLCAAALGTPWIVHSFTLTEEGLSRRTGPLYPLYAAFLLIASACVVSIQIGRWRRSRGRARIQLQYYIVGVLICAIGALTTNLAIPTVTGKSTYSVLGPYFALAFLVLVAHSIIRHRLLDLRIVVSHSLTFAVAAILSLIPAILFIALFWPNLSRPLSRNEIVLGAGALLAVVFITPPLRDFTTKVLDTYVYRHRTNTRRILREASAALSQVLDLDRVNATIVHAVLQMIRTEGVCLYLTSQYGIRPTMSQTGDAVTFTAPPMMPASVVTVVTEAPSVMIVADDLERSAADGRGDGALDTVMRENGWALIAPLAAQGTLVGILVVGSPLSGDPFSSEDLDALFTLASHAGSAVKNAQFYAEVALARDYIENILTTIPSGVISISADGRVVLFNPAAEQLSGLARAEALTGGVSTFPAPLAMALRDALSTDERRIYPELGISLLDPARFAICTTAPLHDHAGHRVGAVAVFSDLAQIRELERERLRAERLAAFQVLTQALAHEIANPISPIKTMTRLLEKKALDRAFVEEFQRIVTRELSRIEQLIERLRTVGRPQSSVSTPVSLSKSVLAAVEILSAIAEERGIALRHRSPVADVTVIGDSGELEEMFINLIKNAIEAIPEDGPEPKTVDVDVTTIESDCIVRIVDSGCGFPPQFIDQIFVPFVTTKARGSGLGLTICASIAQRAGGRIEVANGKRGGIVSVRLPLA